MSNTKKDFQRSIILGGEDSDMNEEKKGFIVWVKAHKKELIITGVSIVAIITTIIGMKNEDVLQKLWSTLKELETKPSAPVRKLPDIVPDSSTVSAIEAEMIPVAESTECVSIPKYSFDVSVCSVI